MNKIKSCSNVGLIDIVDIYLASVRVNSLAEGEITPSSSVIASQAGIKINIFLFFSGEFYNYHCDALITDGNKLMIDIIDKVCFL
jgi:hypothetical protein